MHPMLIFTYFRMLVKYTYTILFIDCRAKLVLHTSSSHPAEEKLVHCDVCDKKIKPKFWGQHRRAHQQPKNRKQQQQQWLCDLCGKSYVDKSKLKSHVSFVHAGVRIPCPHENCDRKFGQRASLALHLKARHDPAAPGFPCPICGKVFKVKIYLSQHLNSKVHGGPGLHRTKQKAKQLQAQGNANHDSEFSI